MLTGARRAKYCSPKCRQRAYRDRARPATVRVSADSFVGRDGDLAALTRMVREHRLVTLTGPAGCGKTRLATEVAAGFSPEHGTWFVDLAEINDGDLVPAVIARTIGVPLVALQSRELLLLLDNCEHVIAACASIVDRLVRECPRLTVLATSREALRVPGERTYPLSGLDTTAAVRLFTDRAKAADPRFEPAAGVAELCTRLDGLPLAIELAAPWVRLLPVQDVLARLDDLLTTGYRTASPRHRSLSAAVGWSYDLLSADGQAAFRALSVLAGPFPLEMADAVCGRPALHLLDELAAKSLLHTEPGRYRMLESIRAHGRELGTGDAGERLAAWVHDQLAPHAERFSAPPAVLRALDGHWQSVRVALDWAIEHNDPRQELIAYALATSWVARGNLEEARRVLTRAPQRGQVLAELSGVAGALGDYDTALAAADAVRTEAPGLRAAALHGRGAALRFLGRVDEAREAYGQALEILRAHDEPVALGTVLNNSAWAEIEWGDRAAAVALLDEGLAVLRDQDVPRKLAVMLHTAGTLALERGDDDAAQALFAESLELDRTNPNQVPYSIEGLALVAARRGHDAWAARLAASAAGIRERAGQVNEPGWQQQLDAALDAELIASARPVPLADAAEFALAGPVRPRPDGVLSEQEMTVVALVADGLTNRQIARRLGNSPATVAAHLRQARDKLGVRSRAQLAVWFVRSAGDHG
ncbi:hypothetical protein Lesp02_17490 [Lentzea sp. NBRC 105346]|nr:hypothetical protein Lesp02_17490 [Lentzea sp. NBRC 105346]